MGQTKRQYGEYLERLYQTDKAELLPLGKVFTTFRKAKRPKDESNDYSEEQE